MTSKSKIADSPEQLGDMEIGDLITGGLVRLSIFGGECLVQTEGLSSHVLTLDVKNPGYPETRWSPD